MAKYRPTIPNSRQLPDDIKAEMRVSHAGEVGAVSLYKGMMMMAKSAELQQFARRHIRCEERHLEFFENHVADEDQTRLLPVWQLSGFGLGAALGALGYKPAMAAISAIESFVDGHYQQQVSQLDQYPHLSDLANRLKSIGDDEKHHQHEAEIELGRASIPEKVGQLALNLGSKIAVAVTRRG